MAKVSLTGINKSFGALQVLRDITLEIEDRAFVAFVGPSGCGKSTLLRVIAGLEVPDGGEVRFDGRLMNNVPAPDRGAAMVFQSYALYPHMKVWENMSFAMRLQGASVAERRASAAEVARLLQLEPYLDRKPAQLSGGQRQRVAIGRALLRKPKVFLFDEPLSNLDAALRAEMRVELARLHRQVGSTMIYVTHDQIEAMTMADQIVVLNQGEIVQVGAPMELYTNPANQFVAEFIGAPKINMISARVSVTPSGTVVNTTSGAPLPLPGIELPAGPVTIGIRPEHIGLSKQGGEGIAAEVELVEHLGADALVHMGSTQLGEILARVPGHFDVRPDETVALTFKEADLLFFDEKGQRLNSWKYSQNAKT
jgi:multiple sugar transport system ATP-binding protein